MPITVERGESQRLVEAGAQLVEVLPRDEYDDEHLPGALQLPLKQLNAGTAEVLDASRPVVVYCWDALCDMSPRAAFLLERLGFGPVYGYAAGKVDWMAAGLPTVLANASERRALDAADRAPATCAPDDLVPGVEGGHADRSLVVVDDHSIVLGRVRPGRLATAGPAARVEEVMEPGPATVRAHEPLDPLLERMSRRGVEEVIVTSPQGQLLGVVHHPTEPS